jgi:hypothetical protein
MDEVLRSPEGEIWYHGSPRRWEKLDLEAPKVAGSWSSYLGPHFAATKMTAERFANGDLYGDWENPGQVVSARLHARNAVRFENEDALEMHALWVCWQSGVLDETAMLGVWGEDKEDEMEMFLQALVPLPDWSSLQALHAMMPDGVETWDLLRTEDMTGVYLASAVKLDLLRRGHDGLLYENSIESEGDPDECAVVWDEEQIEVVGIEIPALDPDLAS